MHGHYVIVQIQLSMLQINSFQCKQEPELYVNTEYASFEALVAVWAFEASAIKHLRGARQKGKDSKGETTQVM